MMAVAEIASASAQADTTPAPILDVVCPPIRRVGVIVLGMHRSGSSAITRVLSLLGCSLPATPMPMAFDNPEGHWESQLIADFNDEILTLAGTRWDDWLPVNASLPKTLIWPQLVLRGRETLRQEFGDAPLFVLKDPRICRLVGFWLEVLAAEGIEPTFVLPLRSPIEVARSLAARNGIEEHYGMLIWLRHVLAAEAATRGRPRVFSEFATLLNNWQSLPVRITSGLGVVWPRLSTLSVSEISQFLNPDLRHHISYAGELDDDPEISPWVRDAFEVLLGWARDGEKTTDHLVLDQITAAFDTAGIAFARPMLTADIAARRAVVTENERIASTAEHDRVARRLGVLEADFGLIGVERDQLAGERATLVDERDERACRLNEVEAELVEARAAQSSASGRIDGLEENLAAALAWRDTQNHLGAVAQSTLRQREEEIAQLGSELKAIRGSVAQAKAEKHMQDRQLAGLLAKAGETADMLRAHDREAATLRTDLVRARQLLENDAIQIARVTLLGHEHEQHAQAEHGHADWLRRLHAATQPVPRWWAFMSLGWRRKREMDQLRATGLFDGAAYLVRHPDVALAGMDPLRHYISHGLMEGRERT